ncbi:MULTISPECIES: PaaI family thioesterase [unclassified Halomonas]|uniref:PaaI family thioesterase n=1 Tax=unclassified Halomonas TaxID=2609666 RepID=UPI0021BD9D12|nr:MULTISPECIES: PaaI family thioesterase [unclassified Halomonas]
MSAQEDAFASPSFSLWRQALQRFIDVIPHTHMLEMQVTSVDEEGVTLYLPWHPLLSGDRQRGLVHTGVLSMLLDTACGASVLTALPQPEVCPTLDLHISHRRPGIEEWPLWVKARADAVSSSVVFTEAQAWQQDGQPLARASGHFARLGPRNTPPGFADAMFAGLAESDESPAVPPTPVMAARGSSDALDPLLLEAGINDDNLAPWIAQIPYAGQLGVSACRDDEGLCFALEARSSNIGNPMLPALHGGVVAAFMETAAALHTLSQSRQPRLPRLVNVTVDYLAPAAVKPTRARCRLVREGRRMVNVDTWAWQDDEATPIARARMSYVLDPA